MQHSSDNNFAKSKLRSAYVSTVVGISLVLFMLGLLGLVLLEAQKFSNQVKENIEITVFFKEQAPDSSIQLLRDKLNSNGYFKSIEYIDKKEAAKRLKEDLGDDFISFLGYNPLQASFDMRLKAVYANSDIINHLVTQIESDVQVDEVQYQKSLVDKVNDNIQTIAIILLVISFLLALIAIALINNTIRLALYSKRFLIKSMQLVGATKGFIRKPFVRSGIMQGIISGLLSNVLLVGILIIAGREMPTLFSFQRDIIMLLYIAPGVIVLGIVITWISTHFAVNKYLKVRIDELYF